MKRARPRNPFRRRWVVRARHLISGREVVDYGWPRKFRTHYFASREHRHQWAQKSLLVYSLERLP